MDEENMDEYIGEKNLTTEVVLHSQNEIENPLHLLRNDEQNQHCIKNMIDLDEDESLSITTDNSTTDTGN